jgi:hypothetical protein
MAAASFMSTSAAQSVVTTTTVTATTVTTHPAKDLVRAYLARRCKDGCPPPTPEEIRRQLGWTMLLTPSDENLHANT